MNKIYKSVWCEATGTWVATSETARAKTKRGTARKLALVQAVLAGAAWVGGVPAVNAAGTAAETYFDAATLSPLQWETATASRRCGRVRVQAVAAGRSTMSPMSLTAGSSQWQLAIWRGQWVRVQPRLATLRKPTASAHLQAVRRRGPKLITPPPSARSPLRWDRERRPSALVPKLTAPTRSQSATARLPHRTTASRWEQTRPRRWLLPIWPWRVTHRLGAGALSRRWRRRDGRSVGRLRRQRTPRDERRRRRGPD